METIGGYSRFSLVLNSIYQRFPWVLQMDNTYNTKQWQMALLHVIGVTHVGSNYLTFSLVGNEHEDGFHCS